MPENNLTTNGLASMMEARFDETRHELELLRRDMMAAFALLNNRVGTRSKKPGIAKHAKDK